MDPMDRAQNSKLFTFLKFENPSTGSKVIGNQSLILFAKKSNFLTKIKKFFDKNSLNFEKS